MPSYPSKEAEARATKEAAFELARLIYNVYKNPAENGIIEDGRNETNEEESD
jgi:hypothetical protein